MFKQVYNPGTANRLLVTIVCIAAVAWPMFTGGYYHYIGTLALINIIVAIGLNVLTGNAGQISLAQASFMAVGAYTTSYLMSQAGLAFWIAMPAGGVFAGFFGLILGFPALRIRGFFLAVVTLGFLQITQLVIEQLPSITGGVRGTATPRPAIFGATIDSDFGFYYLTLLITVASVWTARSLLMSTTGRALEAVRSSEVVAQTLGIPVAQMKLIAFVFAAFYAGIGGGLFASFVGFIDPLEFGLWTSIKYIIMISVGGLGSLVGSVVGGVVITVLPEMLRGFQEYNELIYGCLVLVILIMTPKGLVGLWGRLRIAIYGRRMRGEQETRTDDLVRGDTR